MNLDPCVRSTRSNTTCTPFVNARRVVPPGRPPCARQLGTICSGPHQGCKCCSWQSCSVHWPTATTCQCTAGCLGACACPTGTDCSGHFTGCRWSKGEDKGGGDGGGSSDLLPGNTGVGEWTPLGALRRESGGSGGSGGRGGGGARGAGGGGGAKKEWVGGRQKGEGGRRHEHRSATRIYELQYVCTFN
jgi:hypothetical protein